jgi:ATP-dependent exoDNAse (exonuclease V) alpha subunit
MTLVLTADQQNLVQEFEKFLLDPVRKRFIINGKPGCGKTTILPILEERAHDLTQFLNKLLGENQRIAVQYTATTNKAVEALSEKIPDPANEICTIHSFLGLIVRDDYATGTSKLVKTNNYKVHSNVLLFIDEMSMANTELLTIIDQSTIDSKVVFILDQNQILPVFENSIPLLSRYQVDVNLTQIVRQKQLSCGSIHPIAKLTEDLWNTVNNKEDLPDLMQYVDNQHIFHLKGAALKSAMETEFDKPDSEHNCRILAWTNKKVNQYNAFIRKYKGKPVEIEKGEFLIANEAVTSNDVTIISNQEEVYITSATEVLTDDLGIQFQKLSARTKRGTYLVKRALDQDHLNKWINYYAKLKDWPKYFQLKKDYSDLRMVYSSTVHKSQGSTYEAVFLDLSDICSNNKLEEVRRLILVGSSRPTQRLYLTGEIPKKYLKV